MPSYRRNPWFVAVLFLAAVISLGELFWIHLSRQAMMRAEFKVETLRSYAAALAQIEPAPDEVSAKAISQELISKKQGLLQLRESLLGGARMLSLSTEKIPALSTAAYFDLASFVRTMKSLAEKHRVKIGPDERFGFSTYANEGPEPKIIPMVFRQRQVLQYLLETLIAAKPNAIIRVMRSTPVAMDASSGRFSQSAKDIFEMPAMLSVRKSEFIRTLAFKIEFNGETSVLRNWLNQLTKFELPLVVRSVEVEPTNIRTQNPARLNRSGSLVLNGEDLSTGLLVKRSPSDFIVTIEFLEIVLTEERTIP